MTWSCCVVGSLLGLGNMCTCQSPDYLSFHPWRVDSIELVIVAFLPSKICTLSRVNTVRQFSSANLLMLNRELCFHLETMSTVFAASLTLTSSFASAVAFVLCMNGMWKTFNDCLPLCMKWYVVCPQLNVAPESAIMQGKILLKMPILVVFTISFSFFFVYCVLFESLRYLDGDVSLIKSYCSTCLVSVVLHELLSVICFILAAIDLLLDPLFTLLLDPLSHHFQVSPSFASFWFFLSLYHGWWFCLSLSTV